jgi:YegS/Rv2252/BmrU family lipid kinase
MSSIAVIINPVSGGVRPAAARRRAELASAIVDRHGDPVEVFVTERPGHARELARAAAHRGARLVVAWGGDGTINEVASALAFREVPLGIVPAGSGNGLARQLGINPHPAQAIRDAIAAEPRLIDLGEIGDRLFVNVAGVGFDAHVAARFNEGGPRRRGFLTYAGISAQALWRYAPTVYAIETESGRLQTRAMLIAVANSAEFGNGACIAPGARVDDGLLDLVIIEPRPLIRTICQLPRLFTGTIDHAPGYRRQRIGRATLESEEPMVFHVDGEPVSGGTSLRIRVHPGALYVCGGIRA